MKTLIKLMKDDSGASAAEYALILAIIGAPLRLPLSLWAMPLVLRWTALRTA